jgi:DNA-binding beta-propeller fold protein YncE
VGTGRPLRGWWRGRPTLLYADAGATDVSGVRSALTAAATAVLAACSSTPAPGPSAPPGTTAATVSASPATATPTPPAAAGSLDRCPAPRPLGALPVLARPALRSDDLSVPPGGGLWVSDPDAGRLELLDAAGRLVTRIDDPRGPEGVVVLGDGRLVLAEQKPNRLVTLRPPDPAVTPLVDLPPAGGLLGVDGIGFDPAHGLVLVPDSAAGALRTVPAGGGPLVTLARGLGRPVDAAVAPDGSVYVVSESSPGLLRVSPGGAVTPVGRLTDLDDVVVAGGLLYVTALGARSVSAVDPVSGADRTLVTEVGEPQGLVLLADGRLAVADETTGLIAAIQPC